MFAANYHDTAFGRPAREPSNPFAFTYFAARPIPRDLRLGADVVARLGPAEESLAALNSMVTSLPDPFPVVEDLLIRDAGLVTK